MNRVLRDDNATRIKSGSRRCLPTTRVMPNDTITNDTTLYKQHAARGQRKQRMNAECRMLRSFYVLLQINCGPNILFLVCRINLLMNGLYEQYTVDCVNRMI